MRVGILTFHNSYNFGANLQVLAIQRALIERGVTPLVLDYRDRAKHAIYKRLTHPSQAEAHERFIEQHLRTSPPLSDKAALQDFCRSSLDAVLVGSDTVFRLVPMYDLPRRFRHLLGRAPPALAGPVTRELPAYWLDWDDCSEHQKLVRCSLAASATGTKFYLLHWALYPGLYRALGRFDYLTVRDDWTRFMVSSLSLGSQVAELCPDPVFALSSQSDISSATVPSFDIAKTILISGGFRATKIREYREAAHRLGLQVAMLPNPDRAFSSPEADISIPLPLDPLQWFYLLSRAAGFVGIRYHALVSCLASGTPVVSADTVGFGDWTYRWRSRTYDLCRKSGIKARYFTERGLNNTPAARVLGILFDAQSKLQADTYAASARKILSTVIDRIVDLVRG